MSLIGKLKATQCAMKIAIVGVSLRDPIQNEKIYKWTKVADKVQWISKLKLQWAGYIARRTDIRWPLGGGGSLKGNTSHVVAGAT